MAVNKITNSTIFEGDPFEPTIESANKLNGIIEKQMELIGMLQDKFKSLTAKEAKDINDVVEAEMELEAAIEANIASKKAQAKLQKQLNSARIEETKLTLDGAQALENIRQKNNAERRAKRDNAKASIESSNAYKVLTRNTNEAQAKLKQLAAQYGVNSDEAKQAAKQFNRFDKRLREVNNAAKDGRRDVGRYKLAVGGLKDILATLGVGIGLSALKSFGEELITIQNESKGVDFAFEQLGIRGRNAFNGIAKSTRGLLGSTDIKKALVEFENFNIGLESSADLFEFLTVRATQTGKSFDKLKDSLVEGLSKESKLRIDNLGISQAQLNAELEKTPDFVQAVANIAKKEVTKAGKILDEAGNAQQRWNVRIDEAKGKLANGLAPVFDRVFKVLSSLADNIVVISKVLGVATAAFITYAAVANAATIATKLTTAATKTLNSVMKASPWGLVLALVGALVAAIPLFATETRKATKDQDKLNDVLERTKRLMQDLKNLASQGSVLANFDSSQLKAFIADAESTLSNLEDIQRRQISERSKVVAAVKKQNSALVEEFTNLKREREKATDTRELGLTLARYTFLERKITELLQEEEAKRFSITSQANRAQIKLLKDRLAEARDLLKGVSSERGKIEELDEQIAEKRQEKVKARSEAEIASINREISALEEKRKKLDELGKTRGLIAVLDDKIRDKRIEKDQAQSEQEIAFIQREIQALEEKRRQLEALGKDLDKLAGKQIDPIEVDIKIPDKIKIEGELDVVSQLLKDFFDEQDAKAAEQRSKFISETQALVDGLNNIYQAFANGQRELLDLQVRDSETYLDEQRRLNEQGADNELARAQKQNAEAKLEQRKFVKEQADLQRFLAYFKFVSEYAERNPDQAPFKALQQIGVAEAIGRTLFGFSEGTDKGVEKDLGAGNKTFSGKVDNYLGITKKGKAFKFDGIEKIFGIDLSKALNKTGLSNKEVTSIAMDYHKGLLSYGSDSPTIIHASSDKSSADLVKHYMSEFRNLEVKVDLEGYNEQIQTNIINGREFIIKKGNPTRRLPN